MTTNSFRHTPWDPSRRHQVRWTEHIIFRGERMLRRDAATIVAHEESEAIEAIRARTRLDMDTIIEAKGV